MKSPKRRRLERRPSPPELLEARIAPATILVTNTNDSGGGSLRQAILDANSASFPGLDTISFANIPASGAFVIQPLSPLPDVTEALVIDGYTAPGTAANTANIGTNAVLRVEIDASLQGPIGSVLTLGGSGGSTVKGLVIRGTVSAINGNGNGVAIESSDNVVAGNFIGTDVTGTLDFGNRGAQVSVGVFLGTGTWSDNRIGGTDLVDRNILSGGALGVSLDTGATGTIIQGNLIGTDRTGNNAIPNNNTGIGGSASNTLIGGSAPGAGNVISGNTGWGINFAGTNTTIQGNIIGLNAAGTAPLPNDRSGINFSNGATTALVGGSAPGEGNIISGNDDEGIEIGSNFGDGQGNDITVRGNKIGTDITGSIALGNGGPGIGVYGTTGASIGGTNPGEANVIVFNGGAGVLLVEVAGPISGVTISGNGIHSNAGLGIDAVSSAEDSFGVNGNDPFDADSGTNGLTNWPTLVNFDNTGTSLAIDFSIQAAPSTEYRIEFFSLAPGQIDLSGFGEGAFFLGTMTVTTNGSGVFGGTFNRPGGLPSDSYFSATLTEVSTSQTSEFSPTLGDANSYTWTGAQSSDWFNPLNWAPFGVPAAFDTAIYNGGTNPIRLDSPAGVAVFEHSAGAMLGSGQLVVRNSLTWTGGSHDGPTLSLGTGATGTLNSSLGPLQWLAGDFDISGVLSLDGGGLAFNAGFFIVNPTGTVSLNTGLFDQDGPGTATMVTNSGRIEKFGVGTFGLDTTEVQNFGFITSGAGTLQLGEYSGFSASQLTLNGGNVATGANPIRLELDAELHGFGTIDGSVGVIGGYVFPGLGETPGILTINGNFVMDATSTLVADLRGNVAGSGYDQVIVGGTAALDGVLNVTILPGYAPTLGDTLNIVTGAPVTGTFQFIVGEGAFMPNYTPTAAQLVRAGQVFTFTGGFTPDPDNWFQAGNWDLNAIPGSNDTARLAGPGLTINLDGANATIGSFIQGAGTLTGASTLTITGSFIWNGGVQTGAGQTITGAESSTVLNGAGMVLDGRTLFAQGAGVASVGASPLMLSNNATLRVGGLFDLQNTTPFQVAGGGTLEVRPEGILRKTAAGDTTLGGALTWDMDGLLDLQSGVLIVNSSGSSDDANFRIAPGATLDLNPPAGYTFNGNTIIGGGGEFRVSGVNSTLNLGSGSTTTVEADSGFSLIAGMLNGTGSSLIVDGNFLWRGLLTGSGTAFLRNGFSISESGVTASNWQILASGSGTWTDGSITLENGAGIDIAGAFSVVGISFSLNAGTGGGSLEVLPGGSLEVTTALTSALPLANAGTVRIANFGAPATFPSYTQTGGVLLVEAGSSFGSTAPLQINSGIIAGAGTIAGTVNNVGGMISPGPTNGATGALSITGDYTQGTAAELFIEAQGATAVSGYDQLQVGGAAMLDGTLTFAPINLFNPTAPATFNVVVSTGARNGTFANLDLPPGATDSYTTNGANVVFAATNVFVWDGGGGDAAWDNPLNWDLDASFPGTADTAILGINSTIDLGSISRTVMSFQQTAGTLTGAANLTVTGSLVWNGGAMSGTGTTFIDSAATATLGGTVDRQLTTRTLSNAGTLNWSGSGQLVLNGGKIDNSGAFNLLSDATMAVGGPSTFNNLAGGTLAKSGGTGTSIISIGITVNNAGTVRVVDGTLDLGNAFTQTAGATELAGGGFTSPGTLVFSGGELSGGGLITGSVQNTGGTVRPGGTGLEGKITITGNYSQGAGGTLAVELNGTALEEFDGLDVGTATLGGTLNIANLAGFTPVSGDMFRVVLSGNNPGTFASLTGATLGLSQAADATGLVLTAGALTFTWDNSAGNGDWFNPLNWDLDSGVPGAADTAVLNIASTINLSANTSVGTFQQSDGTFTSGAGVTFTVLNNFAWTVGTQSGSGTTTVDAAGTLTVSGAGFKALTTRSLINNGTANVSGLGVTTSNATVTNNGIFNATDEADFAGSGSGGFTNSATGTLNKTGAGTTSQFYVFSNAGTINATSGTLNFSNGFTQTAGSTVLSGGAITGAFAFNFNAGELRGTGSIGTGATLVNNGATIRPGGVGAVGTLTIAAFYNHNAGGRLEIEVGGTGAGQFDVLAVTGNASLIGPMVASYLGGFTPGGADTFRVLTAANRSGNFQFVNGPLVPQYNPTNVTLVVPAAGQFVWDAGAVADTSWFNPLNWSPDGIPGATDSATLGLNVPTTLPGDHSVGSLLKSTGTFTIPTGVTLTVLTEFRWTGGTEDGPGALTVAPGGAFNFPDGADTFLTQRTLNLQGTSIFSNATNETMTLANGATINNSGAMEIRGAGILSFNGFAGAGTINNLAGGILSKTTNNNTVIVGVNIPFTNAGTVRSEVGGLQFSGGATQTAGSTQLAGGTVSVPGGLQLQGGEVSGVGAFSGTIFNTGGFVRPGGTGATGTLTVSGNYNQGAGGTIELEVAGAGAGQFDVFAPSGFAFLNGTLNAPLLGGFAPGVGSTFLVLDPGISVSGTFATVNSPLTAQYNASDVTLVVPGGPLTFIWDGGAGADQSWFNPINWNLDSGFPGAADTAILQTVQTINLPSDTSVGTFQQSNGTFTSGAGVTFTVLNSFDWTGGTQSGAGTTISSGTLTLSGAGAKTLTTRSFINNGTANLSGGNFTTTNATVTNNGVFNATDNADVTGSGSGGFANSASGTLNKTGAGTTTQFYQFTNAGTLNATSGTVDINSGFTQTAGSTVLGGGSITGTFGFNFQGGELRGTGSIGAGIVNNTGATVRPGGTGAAGTITITGGYTQGNGGRVAVEIGGTGAGQFDVLAVTGNAIIDGAMDVSLLGGFTPGSIDTFPVLTGGSRSGQFQIVNGPLVGQYNATNVTLISTPGMFVWDAGAGADTSWFNPANWSPDGVPGATDSATLNINATATLPSSTSVGAWIHGGTSAATLTIPTGVTLSVLNNFTWTGGTENGPGTLTVASGASFNYASGSPTFLTARTLNLEGNSLITATQTLTLASGATINNTGTLEIQTGLSIGGAGAGTFNNLAGATLRKTVGGTVIFGNSVAFTNAGTVRAEVGTIGVNGGYTQTAGSSQMAGGILNIFPSFQLQGGELAGVGAFSGTINNTGGVVRPGGAGTIGTLTTNGNYTQAAGGTLETEIAGTGAGQFDVFAPGGNATLNGTLNAPLLGGFTPASGNQFRVLDPAVGVGGTFATPPAGLGIQYNAGDVTLLGLAAAQTYVWDNSAGTGDWFNPLNWDLDSGVPGAADTAVLNIASTINLTAPATVGTFQQTDGTLTGAATLSVNSSFAWNGGAQAGTGATNVLAGGSLTITGGTLTLSGRTVSNAGSGSWGNGLIIANSGVLRNEATGTFDIQAGSSMADFDGVGTPSSFVNAGTMLKTTSNQPQIQIPFNNTGTLDAQDGLMRISGGGASSGAFTAGPGAGFFFDTAPYALNDGASIGSVTLVQVQSPLVVTGTVTLNAQMELQTGSAVQGSGTLEVNGALFWSDGTMSGSGVTRINAGGILSIAGTAAKTLDTRALTLNGGTNVSSIGNITLLNGAAITNSGVFDAASDFTFVSGTGGGSFANTSTGTLRKTAASGSTVWDVPFTNAGIVQPQAGTMLFTGGYTQTAGDTQLGAGTLAATTPLALQGGQLTGAGTISAGVDNTGATIRPGGTGAAGTINILGNYVQDVGGTLAVELGGTGVGEFDVLSMDSGVTLAGTLNIAHLGGFTPAGGDTFRIVVSEGSPGTFTSLTGTTSGISQAADSAGLVLTAAAGSETDVSLSGGNLVITDINGGTSNDALTITLVSGNVRVSDLTNTLIAGPGASQIDANTVEVPLASITGNIQVDTLGGDDSLTLALAGGDFIGTIGVSYASGANGITGDSLSISGGAQGIVNYSYTSPSNGSISMSNFGGVSFTGLESAANSGGATDVILDLPTATNTATLGDDGTTGNSLSRLSGATFVQTDFANPSNALTINRGNAADTLTVNALPDFNADLTIGSAAIPFASLSVAGAVTLGTNKSVLAVATGNILLSATLTVNGTGVIRLTAGDIVFNGPGSLVGSDEVFLEPFSDASSIGIGAGATGTFNLDATDLAALANGFTGITIGRVGTGSGAVDIKASTFQDTVTIVGGTIDVTGLNAGANDVTLIAFLGPIGNGGDVLTDVTGNNVAFSTNGPINGADFIGIGTAVGGGAAGLKVDATTVNAESSIGSIAIESVGTGGVSMSILHKNTFDTGNVFLASSTEDVTITSGQIVGSGAFMVTVTGHNLSATNLTAGGGIFGSDFTLTTVTSGNVTIGSATPIDGTVNVTSAGDIVVNGPINGALSTTWSAGGSITGAGNVTLTGSSNFDVTANGAINLTGAIEVPGTATFAAGAANDITLANGSNRFATVSITSGASVSLRDDGGFDLGSTNVSTRLSVQSDSTITQSAPITGSGGLTKLGGGTLTLSQDNTYTGTTAVNSGTLQLTGSIADGPSAIDVTVASGAILSGKGMIGGSVSNSGTIQPGGSGTTATLTISGDYTQDAGGSLAIELGGTSPGSFDMLSIGGAATLAGALNVSELSPFVVSAPSSFAVLPYGSSSGTFTLNAPAILSITYPVNGAVLEAVIPPTFVSIGDAAIVEGDNGTKQLVFEVILDQAVPATVTVNFDTAAFSADARSATAGADYIAVAGGLITFSPNQLSQTISITLNGDTAGEPVERFKVMLSSPTNASIDDGEGVGAILDDDHHTIAVSEGSGSRINVFTTTATGTTLVQTITAFAANYKGGVRVAVGDVNGDGVDDVVAGGGLGGRAKVRVFDGANNFEPMSGVLGEFAAFGKTYRGGVFVATGDVDGDGTEDVIVTPSAGSSNRVNIFSGADGTLLNSFRAFGKGTGGVRVAAGDVNGDGLAEIIVGTGVGSSVRVFDALNGLVLDGDDHQFRAFGKNYRGGVFVAAGDLNADGRDDLIVSSGAGAPHIRSYLQGVAGVPPKTFDAYTGAKFGSRISALDINADGIADIISSKGRKGDNVVRVFDGQNTQLMFDVRPFSKQADSLYVG